MRTSKSNIVVVFSVAGLLAIASAFAFAAQNRERDEGALLASAKLTLSDAINYALSEVPGKVLSAELADDGSPLAYKVEVVQQGKTREVLVDAQTGRVISNKEDQADEASRDRDDD